MNKDKTITYRDNTFSISYNYTMERKTDGKTTHVVNIHEVNGKIIDPYNFSWITNNNKPESIILQVKIGLDEYIKSLSQIRFSYIDEFQNWDGNLNNWEIVNVK